MSAAASVVLGGGGPLLGRLLGIKARPELEEDEEISRGCRDSSMVLGSVERGSLGLRSGGLPLVRGASGTSRSPKSSVASFFSSTTPPAGASEGRAGEGVLSLVLQDRGGVSSTNEPYCVNHRTIRVNGSRGQVFGAEVEGIWNAFGPWPFPDPLADSDSAVMFLVFVHVFGVCVNQR